jgi:Lon protease-like protein
LQLILPIFPLNTVLFPGSRLPLKIFEQRYLDMTKICVRDAAPFGVCRIREGHEVGLPAVPDQVGCTALIAEWEMPHLGVFHLQACGKRPFRVLRQTTQSDGLIQADIELLEENGGKADWESLSFCRRVLEQVIERLGPAYFRAPLEIDSPRWVSYRLAEILPLGLNDKQALLELRDDGARIRRLHAYLVSEN